MPFHWLLISFFVTITSFSLFYKYNLKWFNIDNQQFQKKLFKLSLFVNVFTVIFLYFLFYLHTGTEYEPEAADSLLYDEHGKDLANMYKNGNFDVNGYLYDNDYSDYGYNIFLSIIYYIIGPYTIIARLINAIITALCVVALFKITTLISNTNIAKTTALLYTFAPFSLFYLSVNLKESVMIYILIQATYFAIKLNTSSINLKKDGILLAFFSILLFFFRIPLAMAFIASFFVYIYFNLPTKKKIYHFFTILGIVISSVIMFYLIGKFGFSEKISGIINQSSGQSDAELTDKINRGGKFGLSLNKTLIVPLLFVCVLAAPFATFVLVDNQNQIAWLLSACVVKNVLIFFAFFGIIYSIKNNFRKHLIILAITFSYQLVLAVSAVSTSGRYQLVALPFLCVFMGIGLHEYKPKQNSAWLIYLFTMFLVIIGWNYFKLSIRNLT